MKRFLHLSRVFAVTALTAAQLACGANDAAPEPGDSSPDAESDPSLELAESLDFGTVAVGAKAQASLRLYNRTAASVRVTNVEALGEAFRALPPQSFALAPHRGVNVPIEFAAVAGAQSGTLKISQAGADAPLTARLVGVGDAATGQPELRASPSGLDFGTVRLGDAATAELTLSNAGDGVARIDAIRFEDLADAELTDLELLNAPPATLAPGARRALDIQWTPRLEGTMSASVVVEMAGQTARFVLSGRASRAAEPSSVPAPHAVYVAAGQANEKNVIAAANAADTRVQVALPDALVAGYRVRVRLVGHAGEALTQTQTLGASELADRRVTFEVDTRGLSDGPVGLRAVVVRGDATEVESRAQTGRAAKSTSDALSLELTDGIPLYTVADELKLSGTVEGAARVFVDGGAVDEQTPVGPASQAFELTVPLRRNQRNVLIVCGEAAPHRACAAPIEVAHVAPDEFISASSGSRRLTTEEVETLVQNGVIRLDDPDNFHVTEFTVCLSYNGMSRPVCRSEPVVMPNDGSPGQYGRCSSARSRNCTLAPKAPSDQQGTQRLLVVQPDGDAPPVPVLVAIDGRLKTLKEFFHVSVILANSSAVFGYDDPVVQLLAPEGTSAVRASVGTDGNFATQTPSADVVGLEDLEPAASPDEPTTRAAQFLVRGDVPGLHELRLKFSGYVTGPNLGQPGLFFSGAVDEAIEVTGPPHLELSLGVPSSVEDGEAFPMTVTVTNVGRVPARYATLDLTLPHDLRRADDPEGCTTESALTLDLGHLEPGGSVVRQVGLVACFDGQIAGCSVTSRDTLDVSLQAGGTCPNGAAAAITAEPQHAGPSVVSYAPANGARIPVDEVDVKIVFDAPVAGLRPDFVEGGELVDVGNVYVLRLSDGVNRLSEHLAIEARIESSASDETILKLPADAFDPALVPNATYQVGIRGGGRGIIDARSGAPLSGDLLWTFETVPEAPQPLAVTAHAPRADSGDRGPRTVVRLAFSNPLQLPLQGMSVSDYRDRPVALVRGATVEGGALVAGESVPAAMRVNTRGDELVLEPAENLIANATYAIRVGEALRDIYGQSLAEPFVSTFQVTPDESVEVPSQPRVEPLKRWTNETSVVISGRTQSGSTVIVDGGTSTVQSEPVGWLGIFGVQVPLSNAGPNDFTVRAEKDGAQSPAVTRDTEGDPLRTERDTSAPTCTLSAPIDGATVSEQVQIELADIQDNQPLRGAKLRYRIAGRAQATALDSSGATVSVVELFDGEYTLELACEDQAGNTGAWHALSLVVDNPDRPRIVAIEPPVARIGETTRIALEGEHLDALTDARFDVPGASVSIAGPGLLDVTVPDQATRSVATLTVTNTIGSTETSLPLAPPAPILTAATPDTILAGGRYLVQLDGEKFSSYSQVVLTPAMSQPIQPRTVEPKTLVFELQADPTLGSTTVDVSVVHPYYNGLLTSRAQAIDLVEPDVSVVQADTELLVGETKALAVEIPAAAPQGDALGNAGIWVQLAPASPGSGNIVGGPPGVLIPTGGTRAAFTLEGLSVGGPQTFLAVLAAIPGVRDTFDVTVRKVPVPGLATASVVTQPGVPATAAVELDAAPPSTLRVDLTSNDAAVTLTPTELDIPAGESSAAVEVLAETLGDFSFTAATALGSTSGPIPIASRQAVADSSPAILQASSLGNRVTLRVSTDGSNPLQAFRVEVPSSWSPPSLDDVTAQLGNGRDLTANVSRGALQQAPSGGTYLTLSDLSVAAADSEPYAEMSIDGLTPLTLGDSIWRVEIDAGLGWSTVAHPPVLAVTATVADGAGQASIVPDPLSAGTQPNVDLTLVNDVAQRTDPNTIFESWTEYGDPTHDWALRDLQTEYGDGYPSVTVLRTTENADPGYFISDTDLGLGRLTAQIGKFTTGDNDFIGTIFRWQDECNFYLVDWKQSGHSASINGASRTSRTGLALRKVVNCDFDGDGSRDPNGPADVPNLWDNDPTGNATNLTANTWSGFSDYELHDLAITMRDAGAGAVELIVVVDGVERMRYTDPEPLPAGRYGPYSFSQRDTVFGELRVVRPEATIETVEVALPMGWPLLSPADYRVRIEEIDVTADVSLSLSPETSSSPATIQVSELDLVPGETLTLRALGFPVPIAGTYELAVSTRGPGGTLRPIGAAPTVTVE